MQYINLNLDDNIPIILTQTILVLYVGNIWMWYSKTKQTNFINDWVENNSPVEMIYKKKVLLKNY